MDTNVEVEYRYSEVEPITATTNAIKMAPQFCSEYIVYTCEFVSGVVDLCTVATTPGVTERSLAPEDPFDRVTAIFTFMTTDKVNFPVGIYSVQIRA